MITRQPGQTDAGYKAQARLVKHRLDDRRVKKVVTDAREALAKYGPADALAAIVLNLHQDAS